MSKSQDCPTTSTIYNKVGPDFFDFYSSKVVEFLSRDENYSVSSSSISHLDIEINDKVEKTKCLTNYNKTKEQNGVNGHALFSNGIGGLLSDSKKEGLKSFLRQSVFTLTKEVDEMIDPMLSISQIKSCLDCNEQLLCLDSSADKFDQPQQYQKRLKRNPGKNGPVTNSDTKDVRKPVEIDDDMRCLIQSDPIKVAELVKKQSNEFLDTLHHMEQKLEELLNTSMTTCRPMTLAEKLQLRKRIQSLQPRNLARMAEIIQSDEKFSADEVHVDLDKMGNTTLWRLYFYIATLQEKAA